ncbi:MAG: DNA-binding protein [Candidatus Omnitrophica bacterium CG08_land_8_20_14_0_20_41_16]|uniref:DNA-binding protein n=1 Tax=Candidatus Sherwoodlollariibacterium unditelluris TaxID=1974757 RepID=A0A2G9YLE5_9BACT|nr:MAG: DNA-binding protein [Candidatus Omnitrophica bacterium CG23_combo_of_CG06-09_8_20_14_all_41_10]PIS33697.1 MAG: DNA-binding protein [Candidatus Omnitrophica bacterium CG08_land_8_20_14_0_20_41_16]
MLAKKVKELRKKKGISQDKLAREANVSYNTIVKIETGGSKNPTVLTLAGIAKALGVSLDDLAKGCSKDTK